MGIHDSARKMSEPEDKIETSPYAEMIEAIAEMRETMNAMVAGLVADGFTDREARTIVTAVMSHRSNEGKSDG